MKIRTIKPEFFEDDKIAQLTPRQRILFQGLWGIADDSGNLAFDARSVVQRIFYKDLLSEGEARLARLSNSSETHQAAANEGNTSSDISKDIARSSNISPLGNPWVETGHNPLARSPVSIMEESLAGLDLMEQLGLTVRYEVDGKSYLSIRNFNKHQYLTRPSKTKVPLPDGSPSGLPFKEAQERMRALPPAPKLRAVTKEIS